MEYCAVLSLLLMILVQFEEITSYTVNVEKQDITCWTCPDKGSNSECNDWAPDRACPDSKTVCQTVHRFLVTTGESVRVNKQCVLPTECTQDHIGCYLETGTQVCVSCCNTPYCNKEAPHNNHTAINLSVTILQSSSAAYASFHLSVITLAVSMVALLST